ncbi:hypothetical protein TraAM80_03895 [Trypanosoma rangeli]|uniref:Uncharacterized protein n=1 Tax=Trypanosoma rangeli TaxID=5698 RepID=A0A422NLQ0_TRYRA|nr:uncharacterized protein TraAM80_03895 [Trypanosoma rangeli]RNF06428.1 hypothetical protein TraAM80_03895 [Trypanosoma rangeli]|eukprot:RNF06428.1 hypothetical protein TraAM80_03895 [Trypanosoma rangeli]
MRLSIQRKGLSAGSDVRGLQWLRRTLQNFLNEMSKHLAVPADSHNFKAGEGSDVGYMTVESFALLHKSSSLFPHEFSFGGVRAAFLSFLTLKWGEGALVCQAATGLSRALQQHRCHDVGVHLFSFFFSCRRYDEKGFGLLFFLQW